MHLICTSVFYCLFGRVSRPVPHGFGSAVLSLWRTGPRHVRVSEGRTKEGSKFLGKERCSSCRLPYYYTCIQPPTSRYLTYPWTNANTQEITPQGYNSNNTSTPQAPQSGSNRTSHGPLTSEAPKKEQCKVVGQKGGVGALFGGSAVGGGSFLVSCCTPGVH